LCARISRAIAIVPREKTQNQEFENLQTHAF
jgi:hypothetical protein